MGLSTTVGISERLHLALDGIIKWLPHVYSSAQGKSAGIV